MSKTELVQEVKSFWKKSGGDLSATYEKFSADLSPSDVYDIILDKFNPQDEDEDIKLCDVKQGVIRRSITIKDKSEKKKEDKDGNRINPFLDEDDKKKEAGEKTIDTKSKYNVKVETLSPIDYKPESRSIEIYEPNPVAENTTSTLNYESIGFAIGFKKATAKEVLELANGNTARLIPALQWLYKQTSEEELRQRIQEITLDVLFN